MMITLGDILDLHDPHRDSNEIIHLMDEDGEPAMSGPVSSPYWELFEDWQVDAIEAAATRRMNVWLRKRRIERDE